MTKDTWFIVLACILISSVIWGFASAFMKEHDQRVSVVEELRVARAACAERARQVPVCPAPVSPRPTELWDAAYHEGFKRGSAFLEARALEESVADCSRLLAECRQPRVAPQVVP